MKNTLLNALLNTVLSLVIVAMLYIGYQLFYPVIPFVINTIPVKVITKEVKPGDTLIYEVDYCRYDGRTATVYRSFLGETNIATPSVASVSVLGCHTAKIPISVPDVTPPGTYHLGVNVKFQINPLRTETVSFHTEDFIVQ